MNAIENYDFKSLFFFDQLFMDNFESKQKGAGYYRFKEGNTELFAPTFKLKMKTNQYGHKRTPSWTDRIIYRSKYDPKGACDTLTLVNYDSNNLLKLSDHRPVFAQFLLHMGSKI